ncbi:cold shock domain protein 1, partial [Prunus dulcis]
SGHGRTRDRSRSIRLDVPIKPRPFSPSETTNSGRELDWFEPGLLAVAPPPPPPKLGVSTARTQQAGPSRGQAAWDYLGDSAKFLVESLEFNSGPGIGMMSEQRRESCRLAELEQEAAVRDGAESSTSISVTPSFTTSTFASTIPTCWR